MPSLQVVDLNPLPRQERTGLENILSNFSANYVEDQRNRRDADELSKVYDKLQYEGATLDDHLKAVQTNPTLSPTARVNTIDQILKLGQHNANLQENTRKQMEAQKKELAEKEKLLNQQKALRNLERQRGLEEGALEGYEGDLSIAERLTRPDKEPKKTEASQPIDEDQLKRIQHVRSMPQYEKASPSKKYQMLTDYGVSRVNAKAEADIAAEDDKIAGERDNIITKEQAKQDITFANEQDQKIPQILAREETIAAADALNEQGVTGKLWDQAMQKAGLLQFTSDGYREFSSLAKDAVKNQNIKSVIGSQISQMEFGFFRDATISERFSKEANRQIINKEKAALRYEKLYADIAQDLIRQNGGKIPPRLQSKVNEEFAKQSKKISQDVKQAAINFEAIQNVPAGKVLMYDPNRNPLHVPQKDVQKMIQAGATLS